MKQALTQAVHVQALESDAASMAADAPRLEAKAVQLTQQLQQEEKVCFSAPYLRHGVTEPACNLEEQKHADARCYSNRLMQTRGG